MWWWRLDKTLAMWPLEPLLNPLLLLSVIVPASTLLAATSTVAGTATMTLCSLQGPEQQIR
jgi:hypothetical protein